MACLRRQSSSNISVDEDVPSYEHVYSRQELDTVILSKVADCCIEKGWTCDDEEKEVTHSQNTLVYGGSIPAAVKPKNVILFGETGAGKSSVINLMADANVAKTSSNLEGCTMHATEHSFLLGGEIPIHVYDTVGLNEPQMGVNTFFGAVEKAYELVTSLHNAGGIDLLLFCIRGGRITNTLQANYRLFFEILGENKIPLALVVTNLEHQNTMEDWWKENERTFQMYGIHSAAHACITAVRADVPSLAAKREESRRVLQRMLHDVFSISHPPYVKDAQSWFINMIKFLQSLLMKNSLLKKKELSQKLEKQCAFTREDAQKLANMLVRKS